MSTYSNLENSDSIRLISSGKDLMCRACYFGDHCVEVGSEEYERERIFAINAKIESLYIGTMNIVNPHDVKNCYAIVSFKVIKTLIDMAVIWAKDLESGVIRGRETTLRSFLFNDSLYI
ncbi:MAG: hypothetical protein E6R05_02350 [Candidatus Moraniibacteriota bacterium]|nr:MAG: hypothetical protein E6R05_02350 [Candidatus Moranbacteria bacterium]